MSTLTPMMQQYQSIKAKNPDALLLFRLGDFYELFFEDALIGCRDMEITLTARDGGNGQKVPMCGVPFHAADTYISRLINKGHKVAICEQLEDPKSVKGIVKRDVIRVITPGTVIDSALLTSPQANYLACVCKGQNGYGLAYLDISTGEFLTTEIKEPGALNKLADELERIKPGEIIVPKELYDQEFFQLRVKGQCTNNLTAYYSQAFYQRNGASLVLTHFRLAGLHALGLENMPLAVAAAGGLLAFAQETQKRELNYINSLKAYAIDAFMFLDASTRRNLEITQAMRTGQKKNSLLEVLDATLTALGARLLKQWLEKPLLDNLVIRKRLAGVAELTINAEAQESFKLLLKNVYDLERLIGRICYGNATPRDLISLKNSLANLPEFEKVLASLDAPIFGEIYDHFDVLADLQANISAAIIEDAPASYKEGGLIQAGYNAEVDATRAITHSGKNWLIDLEQREREKSGIKNLKVGFNKVFGYYIEITQSNLANAPQDYIRKQTLANCERFITEELKAMEGKILGAGEKLAALEEDLFLKITAQIATQAKRVQKTAKCLAKIDVLQSLAKVALDNGYIEPEITDQDIIEIIDGRHPVVERAIGRENYIPNSTKITQEKSFAIITGPNMAGKSTYMRQVALITLMAKIGSFVPATKALIGPVDRIFTRVGASDDLASGQSTFMVEMSETSNILRNATNQSLVILDEIGRGTSTYDGLSIAWAVAEYILQPACQAKTLFATHYHELVQLAADYSQVANYSVAAREKDGNIIFLRKIVPGGTDKSYGIQVAKLAGLPDFVLKRANQVLAHIEADSQKDFSDLAVVEPVLFPEFLAVTEPENQALKAVEAEIKSLSINDLSPMQALLQIEAWQKSLKE